MRPESVSTCPPRRLTADRDALAEAAAVADVDAWAWVLGGGEDHALVATFPGTPPRGWRAIGTVIDGPPRVLVDGDEWHGSPGWQSFRVSRAARLTLS